MIPKNVKEEKKMVLGKLKETMQDVVENDNFKTHEMLIILIHECWKLIKSDF